MRLGKFIVIVLAVFLISGTLWAAGSKENVSRSADDPTGFQDSIDISDKKPGKYNYYLEAKDKAQNVTLSGPENIFNDPESDLPRVSIVNPIPYMKVGGNLNIVGLAFDDDGVKGVEFAIYRGTDGKGAEVMRANATGTDYWSYFLDTKDPETWPDGDYTIVAWGTDIKDLSGIGDYYPNGSRIPAKAHKTHKVFWRLDRKKPITTITSHEVGALVSGNIRMRGTLADGNGIASLMFSTDEGVKYSPAKISFNKRTGEYDWDLNINTKALKDGPSVIWFQATDGNGTKGTAAHLLFVNNIGPDVKIVYPESTAAVNGVFSLAGYAQHPVGMKKLTWKAGTQSGEIELFPGNHWWSADVDIRNLKASTIDVEVRAEDVSGNVSVAKQRYRVDQVGDLPVVKVLEPVTGVVDTEIGIIVKGTLSDDDGVASIFYSLNNGPAVELVATGEYFQFLIPTPPEGTHNLDVWAKDIAGVTGNKVNVKGLIVTAAPTKPGIASFTIGRNQLAYNTGMTLRPVPIAKGGYEKVTMNLAYRGVAAPASATVAIGDYPASPVRLAGTKDIFTASIPFPEGLPAGLTKISMTSTDKNGKETAVDEYIYVSNITAEDAINSPDPFSFAFAGGKRLNDGRILISSLEETVFGISTQPIRGVTISGGTGVVADVDSNGRVLINALQEGDLGTFTLRVQTDSGTQNSPSFRLVADFNGPIVNFPAVEAAWVRESVPVRFNISSRNRLSSVEFSVDMGTTWNRFGSVSNEYNQNISIAAAQDGAIAILVRATNDTGRRAVANFTVLKDTQAPVGTLVMPIAEAKVNGTIRMAFDIKEMGLLQSVSYRRNASAAPREVFNSNNWDGNYDKRFLEVLMDSGQMPLDNNMRFIFTDKAGNSMELSSWPFIIDQQMDIPVVHIILPQENEVITTDFITSGVMFDDDGIKNIQYRVDNTPWQTLDSQNGFSVPIYITSLTDNEHTITVIAEDIYGVRSEPVIRKFRVSLVEPAATVVYPLYDTILREQVEVRGTSFDRNGIQRVAISADNGNTFNTVRGNFGSAAETVQWNYQFNTKILKDGAHVLFIRVWDRYDIPATYATMINVDNTQPEIILDSPGDGSVANNRINVMGRVLDPNLQDITIQIRGLDGQAMSPALRNRTLGSNATMKETFELAGQADGNYNLAIVATDKAGNISRMSRNFQIARQEYRNYIEVLYPLENEETSGEFILYGFAGGSDAPGSATVRINGRDVNVTDVDETGYFRFGLTGEDLQNGNNQVIVMSNFGGNTLVQSRAYNIVYRAGGPWVTIDTFNFGNFAFDRPYLTGRSGYALSDEDKALLADKATDKETRAKIQAKQLDFTEISFDNGRTFRKMGKSVAKNTDYRYRIETYDMPEGKHYIVIRSTMKNEEIAMTRMLVQVDKTPPVIRLISPEAGGRYNEEISYSASATDNVELVSMTYHLRKGDKSMYEVPGFLQGLYFEVTIPPFVRELIANGDRLPGNHWSNFLAGGSTYMDFGIGLSFFDDNVKIQGQYGFLFQEQYDALGGGGDPVRYGGHVIAVKLLASIYTLPFITVWGPDFEWLYMNIAVGANFSYFDAFSTENPSYPGTTYTQSGSPTWMSALLLQLEFPKVSIPKRKKFRTFSLFTEGQLWFVPTDVDASANDIPVIVPHVIMGVRLYIF